MSKTKPVTQTTNSSTVIPDWLTNAAQSVATDATSLPSYQPYTGEGAAPLASNQAGAVNSANSLLGGAQSLINLGIPGAVNATNFAAPQISTGKLNTDTQGLLSPYTQDVVNTTNNEIDRNKVIQQQQNDSQAAAQHVFGGDRAGVVQAMNDRDFNTIKANTDAQLNNAGYNTAQQTALGLNTANQNAAVSSAGVNVLGANALTGAGAAVSGANTADINGLLTTGNAQQQTAQNADTFNYQNYVNSYQELLQKLQTQSGALGALPHNSITNSTQTGQVYSNALGPALGLGLGIASLPIGGGTSLGGSLVKGLFS